MFLCLDVSYYHIESNATVFSLLPYHRILCASIAYVSKNKLDWTEDVDERDWDDIYNFYCFIPVTLLWIPGTDILD